MHPNAGANPHSFKARRRPGADPLPEWERPVDELDRVELDDEEEVAARDEDRPAPQPLDDAASLDPQIERAEGEGMVTERAKLSAVDPEPHHHEPEPEPEPDHVPEPEHEPDPEHE